MKWGEYVGGLKEEEKVILDSVKQNYWGSTARLLGSIEYSFKVSSQKFQLRQHYCVILSSHVQLSGADMDCSINWVW